MTDKDIKEIAIYYSIPMNIIEENVKKLAQLYLATAGEMTKTYQSYIKQGGQMNTNKEKTIEKLLENFADDVVTSIERGGKNDLPFLITQAGREIKEYYLEKE